MSRAGTGSSRNRRTHDRPAGSVPHGDRSTQDNPAGTVAYGERHTQDSGLAGASSSSNQHTHDQPAGTDSYVNQRTQDPGHDCSDRPAGPVPHGDEGTQEIRSVTMSPWNWLTVNVGSAGMVLHYTSAP